MQIKLRNYYTDSKGNEVYLSWPIKCDMVVMHCHVLEDCIGVPNIDRIWPLKQRIVRDIYNKLAPMGIVSELWVFGSSTQERCNIYSDLDIAYKIKSGYQDNISDLLHGCDPNGYDLIDLNHVPVNSLLYGQILKGARII